MLDDWDFRILLTAAILTGTPLSFIRDNLAVKGTGVPVLRGEDFVAIRANKWRSLQRQLKRFQAESSGNQKPKRPGALSTSYEVVSPHFKFSDIVELKADSTKELPVFTSRHYKLQFNTPVSLPKNMSRRKRSAVKRSPATGRARQAVTPPRNVNTEVEDVASTLSKMGFSVADQRNAKYAVVDINDTKYQDVINVNDGISNPGDVDARLLYDVPTPSNNDMMQVFKLTIPVHGTRLNEGVVDTKFWLVVTEDGRKAVEMESPVCFDRYHRDAEIIEIDCEDAFVKHEGRETALKTTTAEKMAVAVKRKSKIINYTLFILPDGVEREETADPEDEDSEIEAGTVSYVLFSNCEFSDHKGKAPEDGRLKSAFTLELGNESDNFFMFGSVKVEFPTAYFSVHIALDGTQERIAQFGGDDSPGKLDVEQWIANRAARVQAKKNARTAGGGGMSDGD